MRTRLNISLACLTAGVLLYMALPWQADACSVSLFTVHVSPDFLVIVRHGATPVPGIKLEVYDEADLDRKSDAEEWNPIQVLATGSDGAVEIHNLRPGRYLVETKGPGAGSAVYAEVSAKRTKRSSQIELEWPFSRSMKILKAKTLTGELSSNNPWMPFENIHVELWTAGAYEPLAVQDTGTEGRFHFEETKPGIYILRIRGQQKKVSEYWQVEGDIPIELGNSEPDSSEPLSLRLAMSSCGIRYDACPVPNIISVTSRRLKTVDSFSGTTIRNAKYALVDQRGKFLAEGSTDTDGIATLPSDVMEKVTLQLASPGFTLLRQPLNLLAPDDHNGDIVVKLGVQGSTNECSKVNLENNAPQK
ncbi:MAG TPA: prealbumin-like fold domain-containing protein [Candidatus Angelobacter sp.]|nr:prealbumin-like fold domain-containing protein [Candidatus Angelobacter sp.]